MASTPIRDQVGDQPITPENAWTEVCMAFGALDAWNRGALFEEAGFLPLDLAGLAERGRMQQAGAPLAGHNLIALP